jgi:hypothetical protein
MEPLSRPHALIRRTITALTALAIVPLTGCTIITGGGGGEATGQPLTSPGGGKPLVVVPDFEVLPRLVETRDENRRKVLTPTEVTTTRDRRGWWFTAQNVYTNANSGRLLADELTREFDRTGLFRTISREDVKIYMADKVDILKDTLKMDDADARRATNLLDPVRVGREMGADYVVRGQVVDLEMRHSRVFGLFGAGGSARVALINTRTGQAELVTSARQMRLTHTTLSAAEGLARQIAEQIRLHQGISKSRRGVPTE